jgi:hypothetical protein
VLRLLFFETGRWRYDFLEGRATATGPQADFAHAGRNNREGQAARRMPNETVLAASDGA